MQTQPQPTFGDRFVTLTGAPGADEFATPMLEPGEVGTVINRWEVYGSAPTVLVRLLFWPSRQTLEVTESTLLDRRQFMRVPVPERPDRWFVLLRNLEMGTPIRVYLRQVAADPQNASPETWIRAQVGEEQGPDGDHWVHLLGGMGCTVIMAGNNLVEVRSNA